MDDLTGPPPYAGSARSLTGMISRLPSILLAVHPAVLMAGTWLFIALLFVALPFEMVMRPVTVSGCLALGLTIATFCVGALIVPHRPPHRTAILPNFALADIILTLAALTALLLLAIDIWNLNAFDLGEASLIRTERAKSLLLGTESQSSIFFKISFLLYPAGFVIIAREIGFAHPLRLTRLILLGYLPVVLAAVAQGGRMPMLYALVLTVLTIGVRQIYHESQHRVGVTQRIRRLFIATALIGFVAGSVLFFAYVFIVRADQAGGVSKMFQIAEAGWGVRFRGGSADLMVGLLGEQLTYVLFASTWYLVQGLVISAQLFSSYDGPMQLGSYGIDLVSALMRRIRGEALAENFDILLSMNVYGFFPAAFGSLFVDLKYFSYIACLGWGFASGLVYKRSRETADPRWLMILSFTTLGILTSSINTPLGLTNGLVTYSWLGLACVLVRTKSYLN